MNKSNEMVWDKIEMKDHQNKCFIDFYDNNIDMLKSMYVSIQALLMESIL